MQILLETARLIIRNICEDDYENLYRLNSDPIVMKYIGDGTADSAQEVKAGLSRILDYYEKHPGLGIWAMQVKSMNEFAGLCMLKYWNGTSEVEVGYRLLQEYWGKGYATEAAAALVEYGKSNMHLKRIIATASAANIPSIKIIEKLGLKFEREETSGTLVKSFYAINF